MSIFAFILPGSFHKKLDQEIERSVKDKRDIVDIVIPAKNEAPTIAKIVKACKDATLSARVIVVDDGSDDTTGAIAKKAGAKVIRRNPSKAIYGSKAQAMASGVAATKTEVICFIDADLKSLKSSQVDAVIAPVIAGKCELSCGMFDYDKLRNYFLKRLPPLTGQRAMPRWVFDAVPEEKRVGYQIEVMINEVIAEGHHRTLARTLEGVIHRTKRDKLGREQGWKVTMATFKHLWAVWQKVRYRTWPYYIAKLKILPTK